MPSATNISAPTRIIDTLTAIIFSLQKYLAAESHRLRADPAIVTPAWGRLNRLLQRFCALIANPPQSRPRTTPRTPSAPKPTPPTPIPETPPRFRFPRQRGWLSKLVPSHMIRGVAGEISTLINTPDMMALLDTNPHLKPILRSYCFMFALPVPPHLKAPARKPTLRKPRIPKPRIAKPRGPKPFKSLTRADLFKPHPLPFASDLPAPHQRNFFKRT